MLHHDHDHSQFKLAALAFSVFMTLAVNGSLLMHFDNLAQGPVAQITLPSATVIGRLA